MPAGATAAMPRTTAMGAQQTGYAQQAAYAQQQAAYAQQQQEYSGGRGGMYAVIGFLALIALVAGGIVLFNVLAKDKEASTFAMPNVVGQTLEVGTQTLTDLGLQVNPIIEEVEGQPEGTIHRTDPIADVLVQTDQLVNVYYNPTRTPFAVPDVSTLLQDDAVAQLRGLGLEVTIVTEENPSVEKGTVIRTEPPAGTELRQGDPITLVVSGGANQVAVPPVENLSQANAQATLESDTYGFAVTVMTEEHPTIPAGSATPPDPAAGTVVDKGSPVVLYVSSGPAKVTVPPLTGLTEAQAMAKLAELGLVGQVTYQPLAAGNPNIGKVISQNVPSGSLVEPNSVVKLQVGQAPAVTTTSSTTTTSTTTTTTEPPPST